MPQSRCDSRTALPASSARRFRAETDLPGMRPRRVDALVEGHVGALQHVEGEGAGHVGREREPQGFGQREAGDRGHELGAVDEGQALLRLEHYGCQARRRQRFGRGHAPTAGSHVAFAHECQSQMRQGSEVAARAHRALRGHDRVDADG